ncbi:fimbrial protein [Citrobacter sp. On2M]|nr:fimbrial protein [Citrobacter sp. On2M]
MRTLMLCLGLWILIMPVSQAITSDNHLTGDTTNLRFYGVLKRKPCHINGDSLINIDFGKVRIKKIDGLNYKQKIPYSITCEEYSPELKLTLAINGASYFEKSVLTTTVDGLGLKLLANGADFEMNKPVQINFDSGSLILEAVPVQKPGATLPEKAFSATATLLAEYL